MKPERFTAQNISQSGPRNIRLSGPSGPIGPINHNPLYSLIASNDGQALQAKSLCP